MRDQILRFLKAIDEALAQEAPPGETLDLYPIGRAALVLWYDLGRGSAVTRDLDVVQITYPPVPLLESALRQFGQGTVEAARHGLYLEPVPAALPPLSGGFRTRCTLAEGPWTVLRVHRLDVHDLAVSKLRRFAPKDRQDLRYLCEQGLLETAKLRSVLASALAWEGKDGEEEGDRHPAVVHLDRVIAYLEGESRDL